MLSGTGGNLRSNGDEPANLAARLADAAAVSGSEADAAADEPGSDGEIGVEVAVGGGAVRIHQDAKLFASLLEDGETLRYDLPPNRYAWLQVARGAVTLNRQQLRAGDGAAVSQESALQISATSNGSEILLFDLA